MNLVCSSKRDSGKLLRKGKEVCEEFRQVAIRQICCYGVLTE